MRTLTLTALLALTATTAQARPIVLWHVPDNATQSVDGADTELDTYRDRFTDRKQDIEAAKGDLQEAKARRRDARVERKTARFELREDRRTFRKAKHKDWSDKELASAADAYADAIAKVDRTKDHMTWHNALIDAERAEIKLAKAQTSRAAAELEYQQAYMLYTNDAKNAWMFDPKRFAEQRERLNDKVDRERADTNVAKDVTKDERSDYVSANLK